MSRRGVADDPQLLFLRGKGREGKESDDLHWYSVLLNASRRGEDVRRTDGDEGKF